MSWRDLIYTGICLKELRKTKYMYIVDVNVSVEGRNRHTDHQI